MSDANLRTQALLAKKLGVTSFMLDDQWQGGPGRRERRLAVRRLRASPTRTSDGCRTSSRGCTPST